MKTVEEAKKWMDAEENRQPCMENYLKSKDIPDFLRSPRTELLWMAGCWLNTVLYQMGASDQQVHDIGFAAGQRSVFQCPVAVAVAYANEFEETSTVKDKPGIEFADELNREHIRIIRE